MHPLSHSKRLRWAKKWKSARPWLEAESKQQQVTVEYKPAQIATLTRCCVVARGAIDAVVRAGPGRY
jgi:hypothetical protein